MTPTSSPVSQRPATSLKLPCGLQTTRTNCSRVYQSTHLEIDTLQLLPRTFQEPLYATLQTVFVLPGNPSTQPRIFVSDKIILVFRNLAIYRFNVYSSNVKDICCFPWQKVNTVVTETTRNPGGGSLYIIPCRFTVAVTDTNRKGTCIRSNETVNACYISQSHRDNVTATSTRPNGQHAHVSPISLWTNVTRPLTLFIKSLLIRLNDP